MGTPTKVYSLSKILLSLIRVYPKREFQVSKRELVNDMSLIHGMVRKVINHTRILIYSFCLFLFLHQFISQILSIPYIILHQNL